MEERARPAAGPKYPWVLIGLLWCVAFLNAADRSILIAVMPQLREQFGLTPTELALLSSVFFWIYAVTAFLAGRLGDSARRTRVIIYGLIFWSVATGFSSLANGFALLLACRGLVAFGDAQPCAFASPDGGTGWRGSRCAVRGDDRGPPRLAGALHDLRHDWPPLLA